MEQPTIRLVTGPGDDLVADVETLPWKSPPGAVLWGQRLFVRGEAIKGGAADGTLVYRETFMWVHPCQGKDQTKMMPE